MESKKEVGKDDAVMLTVLLLFLVLAFLGGLSGCKTKEKLSKSYIKTERKSLTIRDTVLEGFELRPMPIVLTKFEPGDTVYLTDKTTQAELILWKNKYGELEAECKQGPKIITRTEVIKEKGEKEIEYREKQVTRTKFNWLTWLPWGLIGIALAFFLLRNRLYKYLNK